MVGKSVRFYQRHITMPQARCCFGQVNNRSGCKPGVWCPCTIVKGQPRGAGSWVLPRGVLYYVGAKPC